MNNCLSSRIVESFIDEEKTYSWRWRRRSHRRIWNMILIDLHSILNWSQVKSSRRELCGHFKRIFFSALPNASLMTISLAIGIVFVISDVAAECHSINFDFSHHSSSDKLTLRLLLNAFVSADDVVRLAWFCNNQSIKQIWKYFLDVRKIL